MEDGTGRPRCRSKFWGQEERDQQEEEDEKDEDDEEDEGTGRLRCPSKQNKLMEISAMSSVKFVKIDVTVSVTFGKIAGITSEMSRKLVAAQQGRVTGAHGKLPNAC